MTEPTWSLRDKGECERASDLHLTQRLEILESRKGRTRLETAELKRIVRELQAREVSL